MILFYACPFISSPSITSPFDFIILIFILWLANKSELNFNNQCTISFQMLKKDDRRNCPFFHTLHFNCVGIGKASWHEKCPLFSHGMKFNRERSHGIIPWEKVEKSIFSTFWVERTLKVCILNTFQQNPDFSNDFISNHGTVPLPLNIALTWQEKLWVLIVAFPHSWS